MKTYALSENQIQVQMLSTSTAIRAGIYGCFADTAAAAWACCDALENVKDRQLVYDQDANDYFCVYRDDGTGDWD
jgi:hypothetical protein